jgi:hypothetical protein
MLEATGVWRGVNFDFGFDDLGNRHRRVRYRAAAESSANAAQDSREIA